MRLLEQVIAGSIALVALYLLVNRGAGSAIGSMASGASSIIGTLQGR